MHVFYIFPFCRHSVMYNGMENLNGNFTEITFNLRMEKLMQNYLKNAKTWKIPIDYYVIDL